MSDYTMLYICLFALWAPEFAAAAIRIARRVAWKAKTAQLERFCKVKSFACNKSRQIFPLVASGRQAISTRWRTDRERQ